MLRGSFAAPLLLLVAACASPPPPLPPRPPAPPPAPEAVDPGPMSVMSEVGGLNEEAMDRAFRSLDAPVQACLDDGTGRLGVLGGAFKLKLRIDREGHARWVYMSETSLGDRDTERCVLTLLRDKRWPKPVGGDGMAERAYEIEPRSTPATLEAKRVKTAVQKAREKAWRCRKGRRGKFDVTLYLRPDGRVLAAGVAPPNERGEEAVDCIVETMRKQLFGGVGRKSKLRFDIWW